MHRVDIEEAKESLDRLLAEALRGEEVVLTRDDQAVARLVAVGEPRRIPTFGSAAGTIQIAPDFESPVEGFDHDIR